MKNPFAGNACRHHRHRLPGRPDAGHRVREARPVAAPHRPPPGASETASVVAAIALMKHRGLTDDAALATTLRQQNKWRAASPTDAYMAQAEHAGDTPIRLHPRRRESHRRRRPRPPLLHGHHPDGPRRPDDPRDGPRPGLPELQAAPTSTTATSASTTPTPNSA